MWAEYHALAGSEGQAGWLREATYGRRAWRAHAAGAALLLALVVLAGLLCAPGRPERAALAGLEDAFANANGTEADNVTAGELDAVNTSSEAESTTHAADAVQSAIKMAHDALQQQRFSLKDPLLADFPAEVTASMNLSTRPCDNFYEYAW